MKKALLLAFILLLSWSSQATAAPGLHEPRERAEPTARRLAVLNGQLKQKALQWFDLAVEVRDDGESYQGQPRSIAVISEGDQKRLVHLQMVEKAGSFVWSGPSKLKAKFSANTTFKDFYSLPEAVVFTAEDREYLVTYYWNPNQNQTHFKAISKASGKVTHSAKLADSKEAARVLKNPISFQQLIEADKLSFSTKSAITGYGSNILILTKSFEHKVYFWAKDRWNETVPKLNNAIYILDDLNGDGIGEVQTHYYEESRYAQYEIRRYFSVINGGLEPFAKENTTPNFMPGSYEGHGCQKEEWTNIDMKAIPFPILKIGGRKYHQDCPNFDPNKLPPTEEYQVIHQWSTKHQSFLPFKTTQGDSKEPTGYTDNKDKTITDNQTGFTWEQHDKKAFANDFARAYEYCEKNKGGLPGFGWRLPTKTELLTLLKKQPQGPWVDPALVNTENYIYITQSHTGATPAQFWVISFSDGKVFEGGEVFYDADAEHEEPYIVRCIKD